MCTVTNTPLRVNRVNDCLKAISLPEVPSELEMPHHKIRKELRDNYILRCRDPVLQ